MDVQTLRNFEQQIAPMVPGFRVGFKDETVSQKIIGFFLYPFNPTYMTKFVSTFYPVVYFPSRDSYESAPRSSLTVLAHELVHLLDTKSHPIWFRLSYLFPQALSLLAFAVYVSLSGWRAYPLAILFTGFALGCALAPKSMGGFWALTISGAVAACMLAVLVNHWLSIPLFVGFALLAPWPAPGRVYWELRGYTMNLAMMLWTYGMTPDIVREMLIRHFIRSDYYYMSWSRSSIEKAVNERSAEITSGDICKIVPYGQVHDFLVKNGELRA